jgi:hypothetical protein
MSAAVLGCSKDSYIAMTCCGRRPLPFIVVRV